MERGEMYYSELLMPADPWPEIEIILELNRAVDDAFDEIVEISLEEKVESFLHEGNRNHRLIFKDQASAKKLMASFAGEDIETNPEKAARYRELIKAIDPEIEFDIEDDNTIYGGGIIEPNAAVKALHKWVTEAEEKRSDWKDKANCLNKNQSVFYPNASRKGERIHQIEQALAICANCEVKIQCNSYAEGLGLDDDELGPHVIGGRPYGLTAHEKSKLVPKGPLNHDHLG